MTKIVRMSLAVATMTAVMLLFVVTLIRSNSFNAPSTAESERDEPNASEQARDDFGLSADTLTGSNCAVYSSIAQASKPSSIFRWKLQD